MRNCLALCSCLALIAMVGCSKSSDPLGAFEYKIKNGQETAAKTRLHSPDGRWQKIRFDVTNVQYDVQESDSLASPYTAELEFSATPTWSALVDDKSAADAVQESEMNDSEMTDGYRFGYAFQAGNWVMKSAEHRSSIGSWAPIAENRANAKLVKSFFE